MVDVRTLVDHATHSVARARHPIARTAADAAEMGASLAAHGLQTSEAIAEALAGALRSLPGRLRELEVPRVKSNLEQVADQLTAIAARLSRLSAHLQGAGVRISDNILQDSGKLVVSGFDACAKVVRLLQPDAASVFRFVPGVVSRPYLDAVRTAEAGLVAASDLMRVCVNALPDIGSGLQDIAEDLGRAADLLESTARTIRELSSYLPV